MIFFIFLLLFNPYISAVRFIEKNELCPPHDTYKPDRLSTISGWLSVKYHKELAYRFIFSEAHIALTDNKKQVDTKNCDIFITQTLQEITQNIIHIQGESRELLRKAGLSFFENDSTLVKLFALSRLQKTMEQEKKYIFDLCKKDTHTEQDILRIFRFLKCTGGWVGDFCTEIFINKKDTISTMSYGHIGSVLVEHLHWDNMEKNGWVRFTPHPKKYALPWYHPHGCRHYDFYYSEYGPFFRSVLTVTAERTHEQGTFTSQFTKDYHFNKDPRTADPDIPVSWIKKISYFLGILTPKIKPIRLDELPKEQQLQKIKALCSLPENQKLSKLSPKVWSSMKALLNSDLRQDIMIQKSC
ncbi:MAG TPA: hypothetical protein VEK38_01630 [Candidatus Bathyarchaeia archaeon]|nr:hypothetical protein [Candidatus Bathyarchaeia archaeon]